MHAEESERRDDAGPVLTFRVRPVTGFGFSFGSGFGTAYGQTPWTFEGVDDVTGSHAAPRRRARVTAGHRPPADGSVRPARLMIERALALLGRSETCEIVPYPLQGL